MNRHDDGEPEMLPVAADTLGPTVIIPPASPSPPPATPSLPDSPTSLTSLTSPTSPTTPTQPAPPTVGWFGKLPFLGDFASRRLPEAFIRQWDEWLQPGLAASRQEKGDQWLDLYLTFPVWRFLVPAGLIGDSCWIGVLLPSVDRVGRCFPLTICEPVPRSLLEDAGLIGIDSHLDPMAQAGIQSLEATSVEAVEQRLAVLVPLKAQGPLATAAPRPIPLQAWLRSPPAGGGAHAWPLHGTIAAALAAAASQFVVAGLGRRVIWWSPASEAGGSGALLLEPFPFSSRLLGSLIGAD